VKYQILDSDSKPDNSNFLNLTSHFWVSYKVDHKKLWGDFLCKALSHFPNFLHASGFARPLSHPQSHIRPAIKQQRQIRFATMSLTWPGQACWKNTQQPRRAEYNLCQIMRLGAFFGVYIMTTHNA
jgi:hypothetical protein